MNLSQKKTAGENPYVRAIYFCFLWAAELSAKNYGATSTVHPQSLEPIPKFIAAAIALSQSSEDVLARGLVRRGHLPRLRDSACGRIRSISFAQFSDCVNFGIGSKYQSKYFNLRQVVKTAAR